MSIIIKEEEKMYGISEQKLSMEELKDELLDHIRSVEGVLFAPLLPFILIFGAVFMILFD